MAHRDRNNGATLGFEETLWQVVGKQEADSPGKSGDIIPISRALVKPGDARSADSDVHWHPQGERFGAGDEKRELTKSVC